MVSPSTKRRAVNLLVEQGLGYKAQACRALGLARSSAYLTSQASDSSRELHSRIIDLSHGKPRYGYRRVTALIRREGETINAKRVQRVRRQEGLQVTKQQRKMKRVGQSTAERQRAERPGHVWSWDFVADQTDNGSRFRILTILDEFTRQWVGFRVAHSIRAVDVIETLQEVIKQYGPPEHIRSDNGPEFIAYAVQDWLKEKAIKTIYIQPGSPWENGYIESFHDKIRDECLNRELFGSQLEARVVIGEHRREYNDQRPHSSLNYQPPNQYASALTPLRPTASAPSVRTEPTNHPQTTTCLESLLLMCPA